MDMDMIKSMRVEELKSYLRVRALRVSGKKEDLVARVFHASENNVLPVKTAEEVETEIRKEVEGKLVVDGKQIPNPLLLENGWLSEEEGIVNWPMVLYPDVCNYLMFNPSELASSDLSDYKTCKAYSYYKCGWLQPLSYHAIDNNSNFCLLKGDCRKSERLNDPFHKLWLVINKRSAKIMSAHCTCMAGLSQTCNHVAAALFRIEAAVRSGLTNPSCTSTISEWLPNRKEVKPCKVKNINFDREDFGGRGKQKKRSFVSTPKKIYNPLADSNRKRLTLCDIARALESVAPDSILFTAVPKPEIDFVREVITMTAINDLHSTAVSIDDIIIMSDDKKSFNSNMLSSMNEDNILEIERITRGQSSNELWFQYRKGVITASKSHEVITKMTKVEKGGGGNINMYALNQKISGLAFVSPDIPALKYGRAMEDEAVKTFVQLMKGKHTNFAVSECGLFLDTELPYVGSSPDRIVSCTCCKQSCLEVKCPYSINYTSPRDPDVKGKLPYLVHNDNLIKLNRKHQYYTQCQVQMGVTKNEFCYFMVWTPHGYVIERINFDEELWDSMKKKFFLYYNDFYLNTIFPTV